MTCDKVQQAGKTLADVTLHHTFTDAQGNTVPGTVAWRDAPITVVTLNTAYPWDFTPTDVNNFNTTSGSLTPWGGTVPVISTQPTDQTVTEGQQATFILTATGDPAPTYQWQINRNNGAGFVDIAGATGAAYTTSVTQLQNNGYQYRCIASNTTGIAATSNVATLRVVKAVVPPKTGDNAALGLWFTLMLLGGVGLMTLLFRRRRKA